MRQTVSIAAVLILLLLVASIPAVRVTAQDASLAELLPTAAEIGPGFVVLDDRARTLAEQAAGFANPDEAARLLSDWSWRENAFKVFQATALTATGAPVATIDISLTRFANTADAASAMPYFLGDRTAMLGQREMSNPLDLPPIGDEMRVVSGDVEGGNDTTLYVRSGPLLLRISATTVPGEPAVAPHAIATEIIVRAGGQSPSVIPGLQPENVLFQAETLPLDNAACFRVAGEGELDVPAVAERLATGSAVTTALDDLGWQGGAFRQLTCDPPPGRAGWIDMSVHRFRDPAAAAAAVAMFAATRANGMDLQPVKVIALGDGDAALAGPAVNGTEYTRYVSSGPRLFAITGVAPEGDPRSDVEQIASALVALAGSAPDAAIAVPTSTPYVLDAAPTVAPVATATPIPLPTATPVPTATFVPAPTAVPIPTAIPTEPPPPTTIPVVIAPPAPTAIPPRPTATTGPLQSPTPRVIHIPTPDAD